MFGPSRMGGTLRLLARILGLKKISPITKTASRRPSRGDFRFAKHDLDIDVSGKVAAGAFAPTGFS
ncbi:hypothetical protein J2Z50_001518 [Ensifer mexicanus]|nr:hypothetical protein [Sinorhizobium mexicanum]